MDEHRSGSADVVTPAGRRTAVRVAIAGLVANVVIVLTGALVRLTGSGLGCPTWPRCTDDSFVTTPEMGAHGVVEFANRVVGIAVGLITLLVVIAVLRHRPRPRPAAALAIGTLALVVLQGFVGGLSVRQELAPEIVAVHFLVSMIIIAGATVLVDILRRPEARLGAPEHQRIGWVVATVPVALIAVLVLGTLVTGSGPHAGDEGARRFGLDPAALSRLHADAVLVFLALQIAVLVALRVAGASSVQRRAALLLLGASLVQGAIGYAQYALRLPVPLVAAHVLGAALLTFAVTHLVVTVWWDASARNAGSPPPRRAAGSC